MARVKRMRDDYDGDEARLEDDTIFSLFQHISRHLRCLLMMSYL